MHLADLNFPSPSSVFNNTATLPTRFASRILMYAIPLAGIYFFIRLLTAGFSMMSSQGDPAKIQTAQSVVTNSLFGLLIVICVYFIVQAVAYITGLSLV